MLDEDQIEEAILSATQLISDRRINGIQEVQDNHSMADRFLSGEMTARSRIPTGIKHIDELTGGLQRGSLNLIVANTGAGKTFFSIYLMKGLLDSDKTSSALFYSLEMKSAHIWQRFLSIVAGRSISGVFGEQRKFLVEQTKEYNVKYFDQDYADINKLIASAKMQAMKNPVSVIVVDYLSLVQVPSSKDRMDLKVTYVAQQLSSLAKSLDCAVIALCQANRDPMKRPPGERTPYKTEIADSSGPAREATLILAIDRPDKDFDEEEMSAHQYYKDKFHVKCRKNRDEHDSFETNLVFQDGIFHQVPKDYFGKKPEPKKQGKRPFELYEE